MPDNKYYIIGEDLLATNQTQFDSLIVLDLDLELAVNSLMFDVNLKDIDIHVYEIDKSAVGTVEPVSSFGSYHAETIYRKDLKEIATMKELSRTMRFKSLIVLDNKYSTVDMNTPVSFVEKFPSIRYVNAEVSTNPSDFCHKKFSELCSKCYETSEFDREVTRLFSSIICEIEYSKFDVAMSKEENRIIIPLNKSVMIRKIGNFNEIFASTEGVNVDLL